MTYYNINAKRLLIIIICILFCNPFSVFARFKKPADQFITINGALGYSLLRYDLPTNAMTHIAGFSNIWGTSPKDAFKSKDVFKQYGGPGVELGVGYEVHKNHFLFNVGVDFEYLYSFDAFNAFTGTRTNLVDTEGDPIKNMFYDFHDFTNTNNYAYVNIPIGIGFNTQAMYGFVGAKVGINVLGTTTSSIQYRTAAEYDRFIDPFTGMPDHFLKDFTTESKSEELKLLPNIAAQAELGFNIGGKRFKKGTSIRYRIGLFCEYGLMNVHNNKAPKKAWISYTNPHPELMLTPVLNAFDMKKNDVLPLFVGVRYTILFELPKPRSCHCIGTYRPKKSTLKRKK